MDTITKQDQKEFEEMFGLEDKAIHTKNVTLTQVLERAMEEQDNTTPKDWVSFGYMWMDEQLTGLFPGELLVLGGESGTGKSTFATNIVFKASRDRKCTVYALEDRITDYGLKLLYFQINQNRKQEGKKAYPWNDFRRNEIIDPNFKNERQRAYEQKKNNNVIFKEVDEQMTIEFLEELIKQDIKNGTSLFLVDHLHYFDLSRGKQSKSDYVEQVMVRLKTILNVTGGRMILVVHYKKLGGSKPTLDSFKDSISIVQNASYVVNLWRDRSEGAGPTETIVSIPKSRNPNGEATIKVFFDKETNDYKDISFNVKSEWKTGAPQEFTKNNRYEDTPALESL
jgi:replicative DNA helicase